MIGWRISTVWPVEARSVDGREIYIQRGRKGMEASGIFKLSLKRKEPGWLIRGSRDNKMAQSMLELSRATAKRSGFLSRGIADPLARNY